MRSAINSLLTRLGSLHLTMVLMLVLLLTILATYKNDMLSINWVAIPLSIIGVNLLSAIIINRRFRQQGGLLLFHIGLLAVILLAAVGTLTSFDARLEITEGQAFNASDVEVMHEGIFHSKHLQDIEFIQGKVEVDFVSAQRRGNTRSQIYLPGQANRPASLTIGDKATFKQGGYRFLTTGNKGYSMILTWISPDGEESTGAINMPSYPFFEWKQENEWVAPNGERILLKLNFQEDARNDPVAAWTLSSEEIDAHLLVNTARGQFILKPGESLALNNGAIYFDDVRLWMGYRIDYNATLIWQFLAATIAIVGLCFHFRKKLFKSRSHLQTSVANDLEHELHV